MPGPGGLLVAMADGIPNTSSRGESVFALEGEWSDRKKSYKTFILRLIAINMPASRVAWRTDLALIAWPRCSSIRSHMM